MAFQNNSGGIILDATLTDVGRKYMAQGKFRVVKFALGDDEINYALVSGSVNTVNHKIPRGVLPPVLEAFGGQLSNINYGLISVPRPDLLYIPMLKLNNKIDTAVLKHNNFIHLSVNKETNRKLQSDLTGSTKILQANSYDKNCIIVESGIEIPPDPNDSTLATGSADHVSSDLRPTKKNKKAYILNMGMYDRYCLLHADTKLIECLYTSPQNSMFENDKNDKLYAKFTPLQKTVKVSLPSVSDDHEVYRVQTTNQNVLYQSTTATGDTHSVFGGPRASIFAFNLSIIPELRSNSQNTRDHRYNLLGSKNINLFGSGNLYDFIDTTIYVEGLSSNSRLQIPIRITRFAGTSG